MGAELARNRAGKKTKTGMSEDKLSDFASKSMVASLMKKAIDGYVEKHERTVLPCGHTEGSEIGKACTPNMCGAVGGSGTIGTSGAVYTPQPSMGSAPGGGSMGIHATSGLGGSGSSSGGATGSGTMNAASPPEGGFRRSADSIELINAYLDKQSRYKCGHKKGDPNHLEAA